MRLRTLALTAALTLNVLGHAQAPTLQVYSRETVVDITVTDAHGNPVHGLTQSDFTIKEDGKPQSIRSFHEYATQPVTPPPELPPNTYTNRQPPAPSAATNFLLLDFANSAPVLAVACCASAPRAGPADLAGAIERQRAIKQETKKYIQAMPTGTRVGVLSLSYPSSLRVVQSVTSDAALLASAIDTMQFDTDGMAIFDKNVKDLMMTTWCPQQERRNRMTLESLGQIAASLAQIKGRKNLLWFGIGMKSLMDPSQRPPCLTDPTPDLHKAFAALAAAQVTVFPISSLGLPAPPDPFDSLAMEAEAEAGGGVAFYNNNDLAGEAAKAIALGSDYYTVSYVPPGTKFDGRHHSIKVETAQKDLHLTYRDEYYAEDPSKITPAPALTLANPASGPASMKAAMSRATPTSTGILFDVQVTPATGPPRPTDPAVMGFPTATLKGKPLTRYDLLYTLPAEQIAFAEDPFQARNGSLEFDIVASDGLGNPLTSISRTIPLTLTAEEYAELLQTPFRFAQQLDLPPRPPLPPHRRPRPHRQQTRYPRNPPHRPQTLPQIAAAI